MECKVYQSTQICIVLCHAHMIYVHSTFTGCQWYVYNLVFMGIICPMLWVPKHEGYKNTCCQNLCMIITTNNQLVAYYFLKFSLNGEGHCMANLFLGVVMDKLNTIASQNCCNFVYDSKHLVCSELVEIVLWCWKTIQTCPW